MICHICDEISDNLEGVWQRRSKGLDEAESAKETGHSGAGSEDVERHCSAERSLPRKVGWKRLDR